MSVTIVTTLPKAGPAKSTDDSSNKLADSNNATDGLDFASLLLGQLAPLTQETLASANTTVQEQTAEDTTAPSDAVAVLASLNLTTQAPEQSISKDAHETISAPLSGEGKNATVLPASATPQTTSTSVANGKQGDAAVVEPGLVETPAVDDKPARFAVPVLAETVKESVAPKALTLDAQPSTISPLTNNAPAHQSTALPSHTSALSVPTPIREQNWATDFGQKIMWLANNDKQAAQLTLNPQQMGPIDISLTIEKGSATASFVSANADVREAIETAMPRLREMFANAGISLGQTNVSAESFKQHAGDGNSNGSASASWPRDNAILATDLAGTLSSRSGFSQRGNGMVDIFA